MAAAGADIAVDGGIMPEIDPQHFGKMSLPHRSPRCELNSPFLDRGRRQGDGRWQADGGGGGKNGRWRRTTVAEDSGGGGGGGDL